MSLHHLPLFRSLFTLAGISLDGNQNGRGDHHDDYLRSSGDLGCRQIRQHCGDRARDRRDTAGDGDSRCVSYP